MEVSPVKEDVKEKLAEELSKIRMAEAQEITSISKLEENQKESCHGTRGGDQMLIPPVSIKSVEVQSPLKKGQCFVILWL